MSAELPEDLLDSFKAAALSVTKLYKSSLASQAKARAEGYQDCLDDLLAFLDKENIGLKDGAAWRIRKWATERLEGQRDAVSGTLESDDEVEKAETASSPELHRSSSVAPVPSVAREEVHMRDSAHSAPPAVPVAQPVSSPVVEEPEIVVPTQETFNFQSSHPYPSQDAYINLANLNLSDSQAHSNSSSNATRSLGSTLASRNIRSRNGRPAPRSAAINRVAGQKRKVNLAEIFDLGSLGYGNGKDVFGNGPKRSRHT
ncbi:hypothetical protein QBC46DRAFT_41127 [Diplogelasinospora grovesii]|uniref:Uncharacterized protein n=1 Tax=Diplogelasinospora grovesii TaxID=303347 RepID=A0AAN6S128_9PEZI|nr:hypothetical protein QBC46DRAFT_41127 [Diplogelasinospora grovesii]